MNTPAHAIVNLFCLGREKTAKLQIAVVIGAFLPDVPIFFFYFIERVVRNTPEGIIWRETYYQEGWQNFFDLFNSLPLMIFGLLTSLWAKSQIGLFFFISMMLHVLGDLPLHHDDGHRHFFPFSNWRFESPVSYWDPNHYGGIAGSLEILAVIISCILLWRSYTSKVSKLIVGLIVTSYVVYFIYVFWVWI
ncbi:MAG: hypothetical protein F6K19_07240 [Cyanothece sp. SIO1E1]|nr:hypothetical protein [Cyanothece sp. SIO1E1]